MLNIGPKGDGTIDEKDVAILQGIGKWMAVNGDSIHGTTRTPLQVQAWGESTAKGDTLFCHVFHWPSDGKLLVGGLKSNVKQAYLLSDTSKSPLKVTRVNDLDVRVEVPASAPDTTDSVVALVCDGGEIAADPARLLVSTQDNVLRVFDGKLAGDSIKFGQGKRENAYVEQWTKPSDSVAWSVRVTQPTTFDLAATYDAEADSEGGHYEVRTGSSDLAATVHAGKEQTQRLGQVQFAPGVHEIRVQPDRIAGSELMRLRHLTLSAVRHETSSR
jgi:hypothetical protein